MVDTIEQKTNAKMSGFKFKRGDRKRSIEPKLKSLKSLLLHKNKEEYSESFQIRGLHVLDLDPGSFKDEYFVRLKNGDFEF